MEFTDLLRKVVEGSSLSVDEAFEAMNAIMDGQVSPVRLAAFLVGLRAKGETGAEIAGFARSMREHSVKLTAPAGAIDTCGTGGDGSRTLNVSTLAALAAAGSGVPVAKHGNRSVSSKSGSADVLEAAGVRLDLSPDQVAQCVCEVGVGFMFAPVHHGAIKHAAAPRNELGVRTLFNLLGPLTNPAGVPNQLLGVFRDDLLVPLAQVLQRLGSRHVMTVNSRDGLDEISIGDKTDVAELRDGEIRRFSIAPEELGISRAPLDAIRVEGPEESLAMLRGVLEDKPGPARDVVVLNAGAAIYVAGITGTLAEGVRWADAAIKSGEARNRLDRLVVLTQSFE
jgi:anthranilate phosphoribosyltransferase